MVYGSFRSCNCFGVPKFGCWFVVRPYGHIYYAKNTYLAGILVKRCHIFTFTAFGCWKSICVFCWSNVHWLLLSKFCCLLVGFYSTNFKPKRSLDVIMFTSEEPTRFGIGCLGRLEQNSVPTLQILQTLKCYEAPSLGFLIYLKFAAVYWHEARNLHNSLKRQLMVKMFPSFMQQNLQVTWMWRSYPLSFWWREAILLL
mgnify:CR=1 FL=1